MSTRFATGWLRLSLVSFLALGSCATVQSLPAPQGAPAVLGDSPSRAASSGALSRLEAAVHANLELGGDEETALAVAPFNPQLVAVAYHRRVAGVAGVPVAVRVSTDGGLSFGPEALTPIFLAAGRTWLSAGDPSIAFDAAGTLYLVSLAYTETGTGGDGSTSLTVVQWRYSAPANSAPALVEPFLVREAVDPNHGGDKPHISIDVWPTSPFVGNRYVSWSRIGDGSNLVASFVASTGQWRAVILPPKGPNQDTIWGIETAVGPSSAAPWEPQFHGVVYVAYFLGHTSNLNVGEVRFLSSHDGGLTFTASTSHPFPQGSAGTELYQDLHHGIRFKNLGSGLPRVLADPMTPGRVHVVSCDDPDNLKSNGDHSQIVMATSTDFGATFSAPITVSFESGPGAGEPLVDIMPSAALDPITGIIAVSWYRQSAVPNPFGLIRLDRVVAFSVDGGQSFLPAITISGSPFDPHRGLGTPPNGGAHFSCGEFQGLGMFDGKLYSSFTGNTFDQSGAIDGYQTIFDIFP
jgi:hypothetical protein